MIQKRKSEMSFYGLVAKVSNVLGEQAEELKKVKRQRDDLLVACKWARYLYDQLALSPLAAAAKYGPNYQPPTDEDWLKMRTMLEQAIAKAEGKQK